MGLKPSDLSDEQKKDIFKKIYDNVGPDKFKQMINSKGANGILEEVIQRSNEKEKSNWGCWDIIWIVLVIIGGIELLITGKETTGAFTGTFSLFIIVLVIMLLIGIIKWLFRNCFG